MQPGPIFYIVSLAWAGVVLTVFVNAIRLSYRIEEASDGGKSSLPRYANIPRVVANYKIARDPQTQAMRRMLLWHLFAVLCLLAVFAVIVRYMT